MNLELYASISRASEAVCLTETRCMSEPMMSAIGNFSPAATYELIGASGPFFGGQRLTTSHSLYSMQPSTRSQIGPLAQPDRHSPQPSGFRASGLTKTLALLRGYEKLDLIFSAVVGAGDLSVDGHA